MPLSVRSLSPSGNRRPEGLCRSRSLDRDKGTSRSRALPDAPQPVAALAVSAIFIAVSALAESFFPIASLFTFVNGRLNRCVNSSQFGGLYGSLVRLPSLRVRLRPI